MQLLIKRSGQSLRRIVILWVNFRICWCVYLRNLDNSSLSAHRCTIKATCTLETAVSYQARLRSPSCVRALHAIYLYLPNDPIGFLFVFKRKNKPVSVHNVECDIFGPPLEVFIEVSQISHAFYENFH